MNRAKRPFKPESMPKKISEIDKEIMENGMLGLNKPKAKNLMLPSQMETMKEVFERIDKYNDQILKRGDFLMALRTDERVVDFIDADAVKLATEKQKILTLDQVLIEMELDETYEMTQQSKRSEGVNHRQFITWREFTTYFEDYRDIKERNKKPDLKEPIVETASKAIHKKEDQVDDDPDREFKRLLE